VSSKVDEWEVVQEKHIMSLSVAPVSDAYGDGLSHVFHNILSSAQSNACSR